VIRVPLAWIDQQHLAHADLAGLRPVVETESTAGHDQGDRYRVAVLGHGLAWLQAQPDDAHRPAVRDLLEAKRARAFARLCPRHSPQLNIVRAVGIDGARQARGTVVVIDVLRSFTVSAYALAGGARECRLVRTVAEARQLAGETEGALISAEEDALPVEGIAISNSPTQIRRLDLTDRVLIQRSTAGTQVAAAVEGDDMFAASLVVARATVQACLLRNEETLTLVASADHPEDHACARYMEAVANGQTPDLEEWLKALRESDRYRRVRGGTWPGFPASDLDLSLEPDRFDFAMPITRQPGYLRLTKNQR
jgi:2-phosphosulfolactate phosphatase